MEYYSALRRNEVSSHKKTYQRNLKCAGSQCEELCPWQRSWGRRLSIRKYGIKPQESPWKFLSTYPQNQSLSTYCFVLSPTPLTLRGAVPHHLSLKKSWLTAPVNKIPGHDKSVSTYKLLWRSLAYLTGLSSHMWLFTASQLWEAQDALNFLKTDSFEKLENS